MIYHHAQIIHYTGTASNAYTDVQIYCIINSIACYRFRPLIVTIFGEGEFL